MILRREQRRRRRRCSASPATCGCRSPARRRVEPHQLGVQRRARRCWPRPSQSRSASRSTTTSRSTSSASSASSTRSAASRSASTVRRPGHQHRPAIPSPGCHDARRRRRRSPTPAAATTRSSSTASGTTDPTGDIGRIERQQQFIRTPSARLLLRDRGRPVLAQPPARRGDGLACASTTSLDPLQAAGALRRPRPTRLQTYTLPGRRRRDRRQVGARAGRRRRADPRLLPRRRHRHPRTAPTDGARTLPTLRPMKALDPRRRRRHPAAADHPHAGQAAGARWPTRRSCSTASRRWSPPASPRSA